MNIGFLESIKDSRCFNKNAATNNMFLDDDNEPYWDCFIFHDVDMIPEDRRLFYRCDQKKPIQFAIAVSKFDYKYSSFIRISDSERY